MLQLKFYQNAHIPNTQCKRKNEHENKLFNVNMNDKSFGYTKQNYFP